MNIKYWNELENNFIINKVFSRKVEIGNVDLFNVEILRSGPSIRFYFDLVNDLPDLPFPKWGRPNIDYNKCRIGINCFGVKDLLISGLDTDMLLNVLITKDSTYKITFSNDIVNFNIECLNLSLVPPNVYLSSA
ncbi:hypothetical protein HYE59_12370 [Aggregatibacter actinomycetemcomitans]|uniref:Imm50 family immunity protein n=1 Tax=Aggregatibacter actinomycetemcomitans TaxID=714 RepID=UPI00197C055F|nr:Imm50 family immunity protein [Aggregatibacter actinomycetemcomitans]MBN6078290.1 hypothetical protein [Aggregatibacter actinomycetemcomitans]